MRNVCADNLRHLVGMKRTQFLLKLGVSILRHLKNHHYFGISFHFPLPAVNRFNLWNDIAASRQPRIDNFMYDFLRCLRIGKSAEREENSSGHPLRGHGRGLPAKRLVSANPAAAKYAITVVENGRLPGRNGSLRLMQSHERASVLE